MEPTPLLFVSAALGCAVLFIIVLACYHYSLKAKFNDVTLIFSSDDWKTIACLVEKRFDMLHERGLYQKSLNRLIERIGSHARKLVRDPRAGAFEISDFLNEATGLYDSSPELGNRVRHALRETFNNFNTISAFADKIKEARFHELSLGAQIQLIASFLPEPNKEPVVLSVIDINFFKAHMLEMIDFKPTFDFKTAYESFSEEQRQAVHKLAAWAKTVDWVAWNKKFIDSDMRGVEKIAASITAFEAASRPKPTVPDTDVTAEV